MNYKAYILFVAIFCVPGSIKAMDAVPALAATAAAILLEVVRPVVETYVDRDACQDETEESYKPRTESARDIQDIVNDVKKLTEQDRFILDNTPE